MNEIARYAFGALDRALEASGTITVPAANRHGEIPGNAPDYACARYGAADHDSVKCPDCWDAFSAQCDARTGVKS